MEKADVPSWVGSLFSAAFPQAESVRANIRTSAKIVIFFHDDITPLFVNLNGFDCQNCLFRKIGFLQLRLCAVVGKGNEKENHGKAGHFMERGKNGQGVAKGICIILRVEEQEQQRYHRSNAENVEGLVADGAVVDIFHQQNADADNAKDAEYVGNGGYGAEDIGCSDIFDQITNHSGQSKKLVDDKACQKSAGANVEEALLSFDGKKDEHQSEKCVHNRFTRVGEVAHCFSQQYSAQNNFQE
jgi:hypothetical protein